LQAIRRNVVPEGEESRGEERRGEMTNDGGRA